MRSKVIVHTLTTVQPIKVPNRRFSHIHVDLMGPLPMSSGYTHLYQGGQIYALGGGCSS